MSDGRAFDCGEQREHPPDGAGKKYGPDWRIGDASSPLRNRRGIVFVHVKFVHTLDLMTLDA